MAHIRLFCTRSKFLTEHPQTRTVWTVDFNGENATSKQRATFSAGSPVYRIQRGLSERIYHAYRMAENLLLYPPTQPAYPAQPSHPAQPCRHHGRGRSRDGPFSRGACSPASLVRPVYGAGTARHDFSFFDSFQLQPSLRVSLEDVQDLLDAIEAGRFGALPSADVVGDGSTTTAIVFVSIAFERLLLFPTEDGRDIEGPTSRLTLFTSVVDNSSSPPRLEFAVLGVYTSNPGVLNAMLGGEVARQATFRWEIKKKDGSNRFWVSVKGVDGFKFKVKMIASDVLGDREIADPLPFPLRMLGDGPGASHPYCSWARCETLLPYTRQRSSLTMGRYDWRQVR